MTLPTRLRTAYTGQERKEKLCPLMLPRQLDRGFDDQRPLTWCQRYLATRYRGTRPARTDRRKGVLRQRALHRVRYTPCGPEERCGAPGAPSSEFTTIAESSPHPFMRLLTYMKIDLIDEQRRAQQYTAAQQKKLVAANQNCEDFLVKWARSSECEIGEACRTNAKDEAAKWRKMARQTPSLQSPAITELPNSFPNQFEK